MYFQWAMERLVEHNDPSTGYCIFRGRWRDWLSIMTLVLDIVFQRAMERLVELLGEEQGKEMYCLWQVKYPPLLSSLQGSNRHL